jgi:hypothetical protein
VEPARQTRLNELARTVKDPTLFVGRVLLRGVSFGLAWRPAAEQEYAGDDREGSDYEDGYEQGGIGSSACGG